MSPEVVSATTVIARAPAAIDGELPEETVLVHVEKGTSLRLNATGAWLWRRLERPASAAELAEEMAAEFGIAAERALEDVAAFAADLAERGFAVLETRPG